MSCALQSRRRWLQAAAAATAIGATGCSLPHRPSGWLSYLLCTEPGTLDPAKATGGSETWIIAALFEPLIQAHPETMAPMAGVATHYSLERDGSRYTFYLRGHSSPRGTSLANADSLPVEFSRGRSAAPHHHPARWSDGTPVTAHDIVYSWRRYVMPETGNPSANVLYCIAGAEAVASGKLPPDRLGVRALDAFTFQVDLAMPAPYLLMLCSTYMTLPLPRLAIEASRANGREDSWVEPGRIVTSGPFLLSESRSRERTAVVRNPNYFDAALTGLEGIDFSTADGVLVLNLYRSGMADSMDGRALPIQLAPTLRRKHDFHTSPACASHNFRISTKRAPLDNVILRYALNMATDKEATARFLGSGQRPAKARVPPLKGYRSPENLPVEIGGRTCDVLAFDPRTARDLWDSVVPHGRREPLPIYYVARADSHVLAEVLRYQWRTHLGIEARLMPLETQLFAQTVIQDGDFSGVAEDSYIASYPDPSDLLSLYSANYPCWSDASFDRQLAAASSVADPAVRMQKLAECEAALLRQMPFIPLYFDTWNYLERPEIHGMNLNPLGVPSFKYAWIDTSHKREAA